MKIVYLVSDFGLISETFVSDLVFGLAEAGEQISVICNRFHGEKVSSVTVKEVPFMVLTSWLDRVGFRFDKWLGEQGAMKNFKRSLKQAQNQLLPVIQTEQPDVAYIDFGKTAILAREALQQLEIPFVVHFHGSDVTSALNEPSYREELQKVFRDASALIVASHHIRRLLVLEGASPDKIHVVRLGVNIENLSPLSWEKRKKTPPSIVFLGRFTPKKQPVAVVQAFALVKQEMPEAKLSMIGEGSEMQRVKNRINQLGLNDSVKLYGALPRAEALPIVNQHWLLAQHSVTAPNGDQEGFGLSLAEAAALELPIVSTLHNGIPEQVVDGETGFLVREFDYEAMAEKIIKLLSNPELAETMGKAGRENISQLCQINQRVEYIRKLIKKQISNYVV
ncbi:UNVERIFIED_CONTAM: hypothetical protein BEN50_17770 [Euhalothece sp. KZN 001]